MPRIIIFRLRRRRAVSSIIGGVIVLSLMLTALGTVVFVTQEYDQYQQTASNVAQYRNQQLSENLVAISPGLTIVGPNPPNSTDVSGWGSGCGTSTAQPEYNCYSATISNLGTVGVQITRIYINSTGPAGSGCSSPNPQPCILNPSATIAPYVFNQANRFLNPGNVNYQVVFALPIGVALPDPNPPFPMNTIVIATSRGNIFSFQFPLQPMRFGQSNSAYSQGNMKVAYTGTTYDSNKEPLGGTAGTTFCHTEQLQAYPAGPGYAEKLTGIKSGTTTYGDSGVLVFVNPWVTLPILNSGSGTTLYFYVVIINTGTSSYSPTAGTLDLTWYGSNHVDGSFIGIYYASGFTAATSSNQPSIAPGSWYYAIFSTGTTGGFVAVGSGADRQTTSVMWWGGASVTNNQIGSGFFSGTVLVSGLWVRMSC